MANEYIEVDFLDSRRDQLYDNNTTEQASGICSTKRALIVIAVICVLGLTLGLGLGLGLTSDEDDGPSPIAECPAFGTPASSGRYTRSPRSKRWLYTGETPVPGEAQCPEGFTEPPLLLISLDGFRADYLTRGFTPVLQKFSDAGVHAPYMRATFPTKTFPNHYTLVTGLYTESHGIIDNTMYDLEWGEQFVRGSTANDGKWWGGEPIWLSSQRGGKKAATMFWPGSEADIQGEYPDYCFSYDESVSFDDRVDQVLTWLRLDPEDRPAFISLYFHQPDSTGHTYGPFGEEINEELVEMDRVISDLLDGIDEMGLSQCINVVIVADHGMGELYCNEKIVYMSDYLEDTSQYYVYEGVHSRITSKYVKNPDGGVTEVDNPESPDQTVSKLQCVHYNNTKDWYARVYKKEELPKRFHYSNNRRIDDIVLEMADKWRVNEDYETPCEHGSHGYDNTYQSMHAIFMAYGPAFKQNLMIEPFDNIELYNLLSEVLGVEPAPNNGTSGRLHHILHSPSDLHRKPGVTEYRSCDFPLEKDEVWRRQNQTDCVCDDLESITEKSLWELDQQLNLTSADIEVSIATHLPYGVPDLQGDWMDMCLLSQSDYITGYSHTHKMALWSAFQVNRQEGVSVLDPGNFRSDGLLTSCIRPDVRLESNMDCTAYTDPGLGVSPVFLYPPGFSNTTEDQLDAHLTSNIVPMYDSFRQGIWQDLLYLVEEYVEKYGPVAVVTGPVFDYNSDGHVDTLSDIKVFVGNGSVPLPSHYYLSLSRCTEGASEEDCVDSTHLFSVVLPHKPTLDNCWDRRVFTYIQENVVRVRDIELLTGLQFYPEISNITRQLLLRTHLQVGLWEQISWMDLGSDGEVDQAECPQGVDSAHPPILVISIDGYRADYVYRNLTPTVARLRDLGVKTEYMQSVYPSMTFPNHYTQVTGLYPESHGIVDNSMYDQDIGEMFYLGSETSINPAWWGGQPIWNTVEQANKTAMCMFWPGSDVEIQGTRPTRYQVYNGDYPYQLRVNTVLGWLNGSEGVTPDVVTLYFSNVDSAGHEGGPNSLEVGESLIVLERHLKDLMDGLYRLKLHKCVNIMLMSDHGMSTLSCDHVVLVGDHLSEETMKKTNLIYGTSSRISNQYTYYNDTSYEHIPPVNRVPEVDIVHNLSCVNSNLSVFDKLTSPRRIHYLNNPRVDDVLLKLADTWQADRYSPWCAIKGQHGWDPSFEIMQAFFAAFGPMFHSRYEVAPFENIELYNIMAVLSNVNAAANNGTEGALFHMLKVPPPLPDLPDGVDYQDVEYPEGGDYIDRANLTTAGCQCDTQNLDSLDAQLNVSRSEAEAMRFRHLPYGVPIMLNDATTYLLHHTDYVSAYSEEASMPLWTAFNVTRDQVDEPVLPVPACLRPDVRLEQTQQPSCYDYTESQDQMMESGFLFPPELSADNSSVYDALLTTNIVPMWTSFKSGIWTELLSIIQLWAEQLESILVILGPVFDHTADGLKDVSYTYYLGNTSIPIPSHYYAAVLHCPTDSCTAEMDYTVKTFVIPHIQNITNCMKINDYLIDNLARLRDIELLIDSQFLTRVTTQKAIQTRIQIPRDLDWMS